MSSCLSNVVKLQGFGSWAFNRNLDQKCTKSNLTLVSDIQMVKCLVIRSCLKNLKLNIFKSDLFPPCKNRTSLVLRYSLYKDLPIGSSDIFSYGKPENPVVNTLSCPIIFKSNTIELTVHTSCYCLELTLC